VNETFDDISWKEYDVAFGTDAETFHKWVEYQEMLCDEALQEYCRGREQGR
jgi:hypothetical protein